MYEETTTPTPKPRRRWGLIAVAVLFLAALTILGLSVGDARPPSFGFLKGATLVKVDRSFDETSGYGGVAYVYLAPGGFNDVVHRVDDELRAAGGWRVDQSDHGIGPPVGANLKAKVPSTGYYQLFLSKDSGVEVVDQEPASWTFGDRQTMWTPGSGANISGVVTVFVTRSDTSMQWWAKTKARFRRLIGMP